MNYAPIVLFCFNRPLHLLRTLHALSNNELASQSHIVFFCDGPRNEEEKILTDAVRKVAREAKGFASVETVEHQQNLGCANAFIYGLEKTFTIYEKAIIMEDDILCSPHTLAFLNGGLKVYEKNASIFSISAWTPPRKIFPISHGYLYDVYSIPRLNCWGWASWKNRIYDVDWDVSDYDTFKNSSSMRKEYSAGGEDVPLLLDAQMEGIVDAWDVRLDYTRFKRKQLCINPVISYTTNIGMDTGTHTGGGGNRYDNDISLAKPCRNMKWIRDTTLHNGVLSMYQNVFKVSY